MRFDSKLLWSGGRLIGCTLCCSAALAVSFGPATLYPVQNYPSGILSADFNHDGIRDLVFSETSTNQVVLFLGNGTGAISFAGSSSAAALTGASPGPLAAGDFNGDGHLDVAMAHPSTTGLPNGFGNKVTVHLGNGSGGFLPGPRVFATGGSNTGLASADLNGDGKADLVVGAMDSGQVYSYLGNGDATFTLHASYATGSTYGGQANSIWLADFNQDGRVDVATNNLNHGSVSVLLGNGNGGFSLNGAFQTGFGIGQFAVGDFDNDGKLDVVAACTSAAPLIMKGDGLGGLVPMAPYPGPSLNGGTIVAGDLDSDGKLDATIVNGGLAVFLRGAGDGSFSARADFAMGDYLPYLTAVDLNGDGKLDLVGALQPSALAIRLNNTLAGDTTPPVISPIVSGTLGSGGWYVGNAAVSWMVTDAESAVTSSIGCGPTTVNSDTAGVTFTCTATSSGGTATQSVTIKRDATPPAVVVTGVSNGAAYTLGAAPAAGCVTTDALSGVAASATPSTMGGTANGVGSFTTTCAGALDLAGNTAFASVVFAVRYNFTGFFAPVSSGQLNVVNAGQTMQMRWRLTDSSGASVTALSTAASIDSAPLACPAGPTGSPEPAGSNSGLQFDPAANRFVFGWRTNRSWEGSCRRFILALDDGTSRIADFRMN